MNYWLTRLWADFWLLSPARRMAYVGGALMLWIVPMSFLRVLPMERSWRIAAVASVWVPAVTWFIGRRYSD